MTTTGGGLVGISVGRTTVTGLVSEIEAVAEGGISVGGELEGVPEPSTPRKPPVAPAFSNTARALGSSMQDITTPS